MIRGLEPSLSKPAYVEEAVFTKERERIFAREWCVVGRGEDAPNPGDYFLADLLGESLILVRDEALELRALHNVCRHRGTQLLDPSGPCDGHLSHGLRCPYHAWSYALDGSLRHAPFLDLAALADISLHEAGLAEWGGFVFVCLEAADASTLTEHLGDIPERVARYPLAELRRGAVAEYEVGANWKVLAENYNECYHCGPVHPELCEVVPAFRVHGGADLDWDKGVPHRDGAWTFTMNGTSNREPFPLLDEIERTHHKGELIYPNFWLSLSADHAAAFYLFPASAHRTRVVCELLFHPDAISNTDFDPSDAFELWDITNRQDFAICERVQRGMLSRAWDHGYFAPMEDLSLDIRRWYASRMGSQ